MASERTSQIDKMSFNSLYKYCSNLFRNPKILYYIFRSLYATFKRSGGNGICYRLSHAKSSQAKSAVIKSLNKNSITLPEFKLSPLISILIPSFNSNINFLERAINSVKTQVYQTWELCISVSGKNTLEIKKFLLTNAANDARIKISFNEENLNITNNLNKALTLAQGEYITFLDHDDELDKDALLYVVSEINKNNSIKLIYSDEDKIDENGISFSTYEKPDFDEILLRSQNYLCHLTVIESDLLKSLEGFRDGFEGAQDWDLFLRATEKITLDQIIHIPRVLYHWRATKQSTSFSSFTKPYIFKSQERTLNEHLKRVAIKAHAKTLYDIGHQKIVYDVNDLNRNKYLLKKKKRIEIIKESTVQEAIYFAQNEKLDIVVARLIDEQDKIINCGYKYSDENKPSAYLAGLSRFDSGAFKLAYLPQKNIYPSASCFLLSSSLDTEILEKIQNLLNKKETDLSISKELALICDEYQLKCAYLPYFEFRA